MNSEIGSFREFGKFRLDVAKKILWHADAIVSLPVKAIELLIVLTGKNGEVLSKENLLNAVWDESFVEESNLSHNIYLLRKTLKSFDDENYIQTLPRRGYRFTGEIIESEENTELVIERRSVTQTRIEEFAPPENEKLLPARAASANGFSEKQKTITLFAVVLILLTGVFAYWRLTQPKSKTKLSEIKSIAVLPLKAFDDNSDDTLSLKITDALITKLGALNQISVRPTSSILQFVKDEKNPIEIGKFLAVEAIMDGRIQWENEKMRVTLQLISTADGEQIWTGQFDGRSDETLNLQDAISAEISKALILPPAQNELFTKNSTNNAQAFEAYLRGRYLWNMRTGKNLLKAIEEFEKAVEIDPNFALAYTGLADCYALLSVYEIKPSREVFPIAKEKAQNALALNPNLAEAYATLGFVAYRYEWNWHEAETNLQKSIQLKPNYPTAHHWLGEMLMASGRFTEAEAAYKKALELDPTSLIINTDLGYGLFLARRYDESIAQLQKTINLNQNFPLALYCLADSYAYKNLPAESIETFDKWLELTEVDSAERLKMKKAFRENGYNAYQKARLDWSEEEAKQKNFTKTDVARFYAETKDKENALQWLEKAQNARDADLIFIKTHPGFDNLRDDVRFNEILKAMNF